MHFKTNKQSITTAIELFSCEFEKGLIADERRRLDSCADWEGHEIERCNFGVEIQSIEWHFILGHACLCFLDRLYSWRVVSHTRKFPGVDQLVNDQQIVETVKWSLTELLMNIWPQHYSFLQLFCGWSRKGNTAEIYRQERIVWIMLHLQWYFSFSAVNPFSLLMEISISDFRYSFSVIENSIAGGLTLNVF